MRNTKVYKCRVEQYTEFNLGFTCIDKDIYEMSNNFDCFPVFYNSDIHETLTYYEA